MEQEVYNPSNAARHLGSYLVDEYRGTANGNQPTVIIPTPCYFRLGGDELSQELTCSVLDYVKSQLGLSKNLKINLNVKKRGSFVYIQSNWLTTSLRKLMETENLDNTDRKCVVCMLWKPVTLFKNCGRCKAISYCSVDCQKKDWSLHRKACL